MTNHPSHHLFTRRMFLGSSAALVGSLAGCGGGDGDSADTIDPEVLPFWQRYFTAKSGRNAVAISSLFADEVVYEDNTLRMRMAGNRDFIQRQWEQLFAFLPPQPKSLLRAAAGTMVGAAVELTNEAGMFTSVPLPGLSIVDLRAGKIARITDYWDSGIVSEAEFSGLKGGFSMNPAWNAADTGIHQGTVNATPLLQDVVTRLCTAMATGQAQTTASFFHPDATYLHRMLNIQASGRTAILNVFSRALAKLPDGAGVRLTHVVGNAFGGGFEWTASQAAAGQTLRGATYIELSGGLISRMAVYGDSRLLPAGAAQSIAAALA